MLAVFTICCEPLPLLLLVLLAVVGRLLLLLGYAAPGVVAERLFFSLIEGSMSTSSGVVITVVMDLVVVLSSLM